jgi:hypothetical protein
MEIPSRRDEIASSLSAVRRRLARALERAGRLPSSARLVAISKTRPAEDVRAAFAAGQADFGENRVQEALEKIAATSDTPITWHLVGHLQSNKARRAGAAFAWIHSIDSADLLTGGAAREKRAPAGLLIQVDLAGEPTKHGAPADTWLSLFEAASDAGRRGPTHAAAAVHAGPETPGRISGGSGHSGRAGGAAVPPEMLGAVDGHEPRFRGRRRRGPPWSGWARPSSANAEAAVGRRQDAGAEHERHATRSPPAAVPHFDAGFDKEK